MPALDPPAIRAWRVRFGVSLHRLARLVGITASALCRWEHGEVRGRPANRRRLQEILLGPPPAAAPEEEALATTVVRRDGPSQHAAHDVGATDLPARTRLLALLGLPTIRALAQEGGISVPRDVVKKDVAAVLASRETPTLEELLFERLDRTALDRVAVRLGVPGVGETRDVAERVLHALRGWRSFARARLFARSLGLPRRTEWERYCTGGRPDLPPLPPDVPARPHRAYCDVGWRDYPDWLGVPRGGPREPPPHSPPEDRGRFWPFARARAFVHALKLLEINEWRAYCRGDLAKLKGERPPELPAACSHVYAGDGWKGWRDWLGTDWLAQLAPGWRPFKKARRFVWSLGLRDVRAWRAYVRGELPGFAPRPADLPADPEQVYGAAWRGWERWLGIPPVSSSASGRGQVQGRYRSFEEARTFARALGLTGLKEWRAYSKGELPGHGPRPEDVPCVPSDAYSTHGWKGWGDWLGTDSVATYERSYRPFEAARAFVRGLGLVTEAEWKAYVRGKRPELAPLPKDVPAFPQKGYRGLGWKGYVDWLRPELATPRWRPFEQARAFVQALKLGSRAEWVAYCDDELPAKGTLPADIPREPQQVYWGQGWKDVADWLGPENLVVSPRARRPYRTYEQASRWAQEAGIRASKEWAILCSGEDPRGRRLPDDIPFHPDRTYADWGWTTWGEFLGTGLVATFNREYRPFRAARAFARGLGLRSKSEWRAFSRGERPDKGQRPEDIPAAPHMVFRDRGWVDFYDWLGTDARRARSSVPLRPYAEARAFARSLGLRTCTEWLAFVHGERPELGPLPSDVPKTPTASYSERGWKGWGDFLGTDRHPFGAVRQYARSLGLGSHKAWIAFCKGELPEKGTFRRDVPKTPQSVYRDEGWKGWGDFLGTGNQRGSRPGDFRSFDEARRFARALGLTSVVEWRRYARGAALATPPRPADIPRAPQYVYADQGWKGYGDWLGTGRTRIHRAAPRRAR